MEIKKKIDIEKIEIKFSKKTLEIMWILKNKMDN